MPDVKISALPAATTPLAGTEVLPIVQSSTTRQVSVANLTAGRAISASSITNSALTSGRVTFAGASGLLSDSANLVWDNTNARLGIGTSSPSYPLSVAKAGNSSIVLAQLRNSDAGSSAATSFAFGNDTTAEAARIVYGSSTNSGIPNSLFITNDLAGSIILRTDGTERMRIDSAGNVTLQKNISVGAATPTTSGSGITFPATQSASSDANTLDDYEEGTFTPTITFGNASTGITYTTNEGFYTKIGSQVFLTGIITLSSKGSATGFADIKGFPFTVQNASGANSAASLKFNNISFSGAFQGIAPINTTQIGLTQITILGAVTDLTDTNFSNNSAITFSVNYRV